MKKIFVIFALSAMVLMISCSDGSKNISENDESDTGETVTDGDTVDDSDPSDSGHENPDTLPEQSDNGDTTPDNDSVDTAADNGDTEPDNDYPQTPCDPNPCSSVENSDGICSVNGDDYVCGCVSSDYEWTGGQCKMTSEAECALVEGELDAESNCTRTLKCTGLPENAKWNQTTEIKQTWNGSEWEPSAAAGYNETPNATECRFICKNEYYTWNELTSTCDGEQQTANCPDKPENTEWNGSSTFIQTWDGENWTPATYTTSYSKTSGTCKYKCSSNYYWNGEECVNPCNTNPCGSNSTCTPTGISTYKCGCVSGYIWRDGICEEALSLGSICTGQTSCYDLSSSMTCPTSESDDFYGQDAYYADLGKCTAQSFTVQTLSSQKVVLDNNTGLMWQQTIPTKEYTWEDAGSYCDGLTYAGYSDWRLPSPKELLTIVDNSKYNLAVNTTNFPNMPTLTSNSSYLWTSKEYKGDTSKAYYFNPYDGDIWYDRAKTWATNVMCVRGDALNEPVFTTQTIAGEVVVNDSTTGLMWQQNYPHPSYTWVAALRYCKNLVYAGYDDWRLPNKNELASLLDFDKSVAPYSDFPDMPGFRLWSSSTYVRTAGVEVYASWIVRFDYYAYVHFDNKTYDSIGVRCVR